MFLLPLIYTVKMFVDESILQVEKKDLTKKNSANVICWKNNVDEKSRVIEYWKWKGVEKLAYNCMLRICKEERESDWMRGTQRPLSHPALISSYYTTFICDCMEKSEFLMEYNGICSIVVDALHIRDCPKSTIPLWCVSSQCF